MLVRKTRKIYIFGPQNIFFLLAVQEKQEAQGLGALLDKMQDNDHIKLDNIEI